MSFVNDEDSQDDILDNDFIREALLWHNIYRRHHNTPPLKISAHVGIYRLVFDLFFICFLL